MPSDLSFFKSYLTDHPQAKQKGFNLHSSVLEGRFYPALKSLLQPLPKKAAHVDLTMFGPGLHQAHSLARKIKIDAKNLRLNGEYVDAPVESPARYESLAEGDFAIMEFSGSPIPTAVDVVLIAAAVAEDRQLHSGLLGLLPEFGPSMSVLTETQLSALVQEANPAGGHPIRQWMDSALLEEVGAGDDHAIEAINVQRQGRGLSHAEFKASQEAAGRIGQLGEELLDLNIQVLSGAFHHEWVAQVNAVSPFDFLITGKDGSIRHVDAKSTSGAFERPIFLSAAEIRHAVRSGVPYDIYRLFKVTEKLAVVRVAFDVGPQLQGLLASLEALPAGVKVDKLSLDPNFLTFQPNGLIIHAEPDFVRQDEE